MDCIGLKLAVTLAMHLPPLCGGCMIGLDLESVHAWCSMMDWQLIQGVCLPCIVLRIDCGSYVILTRTKQLPKMNGENKQRFSFRFHVLMISCHKAKKKLVSKFLQMFNLINPFTLFRMSLHQHHIQSSSCKQLSNPHFVTNKAFCLR